MYYRDVNNKTTSCKADKDLIRYLKQIANKTAKAYDLPFKNLFLLTPDHPAFESCLGLCEQSLGIIRVKLYNANTGAYCDLEELIDTVLHEMAHLKYRKSGAHTKRFWQFLHKLKVWYLGE